ncbi:MAG: hypothetical protein FJZ95_04130, partial [Chloroflexi bacterium]|nr:hypothetical protein [Chloroflexota bacterium]
MSHRENRHSGWGVWARFVVPLLVVIAVLAIGCSGDDSSEPTTSPDPSHEDQSALKEQLDEIASKVAKLRGLNPKTEVKYEFITSDDLQTRLLDLAEEELSPEEMQTEQEVLVLLDLLEEGQDLRSILLDLYAEQIMGFYDDETGELFVVSDKTELGPME